MEFKKWCPGFKILTYYGTQEERKRKRLGWKSEDAWNVCITSYQLVIQDQQVFKRRRWHYMILDEAHNIKNFQSQRWQTMLTFNTRARLLLTGTPLQNNLTELWSLLYFLMPSDGTEQGVGGFANLKEFQDWFKKPSEQILDLGFWKLPVNYQLPNAAEKSLQSSRPIPGPTDHDFVSYGEISNSRFRNKRASCSPTSAPWRSHDQGKLGLPQPGSGKAWKLFQCCHFKKCYA